MLPAFQPLPVTPRQRPFDGSDWLFELKYDGSRALAYLNVEPVASYRADEYATLSFVVWWCVFVFAQLGVGQ
jgi:hypothetical protein